MTARLWHILTQPPGPPGSARARYAAAMALHGAGLLDSARLEAYREAAACDRLDPARVLADRGLAVPAPDLAPDPALGLAPGLAPDPANTAAGARPSLAPALLQILLAEVDRCLAALSGPGIAEVRAGLAPAFGQAPQPRPGAANAVLTAHLPAALAALADGNPALARAIAEAAPLLDWITYDAYDPAQIGPAFPGAHAFASLVGEAAPFAADDYDLGLFLVAPRILYRDRAHPAPELYVPLTGPHRWRFAPGAAFHERPALVPVWNPPLQPHATLTGDLPLLAIFGWTRDVMAPAFVLPATDWARYEGAGG